MALEKLAITIVTHFLTPYVKKGVDKIAQEVSVKVGEPAAKFAGDVTSKVWEKVKSVFSSPKDKATLEQFEEYPDEGAPLMKAVLQKKLEQDPKLADELKKLINAPDPSTGDTSTQIMNTSGIVGVVNLQNANLSGASQFEISGARNDSTTPSTEPKKSSNLPNESQ